METEKLHFKIGLSRSSTKKPPEFKISVNKTIFVNGRVTASANETEFFEFDAEVPEGVCALEIELLNKTTQDTVVGSDGKIVDDLLLNIDSIEIEDINLGNLLWTASEYTPIYPHSYKQKMADSGQELPKSVNNCINLGWNGTWALPFSSPFYIWLLEHL